jgi:Large polyvalent protein associated domain 39
MNLPEGFTLEQQAPSLPKGFKLEEPKQNAGLPEGFKLEKQPDELGRFVAEPGQEDKTSNPFKGLVARASNLAGEGVEAVARVAENLGDKLETALPLTGLTPEQIKNEKQLAPMFEWANALRSYGKDIGYAPSTALGEIPGKPLLLVPFIAERVISSAPDMAAAVLAAPAYVMSRTNEILNDRLTNDKKNLEDATVADVTAAVGAAVLETTLERFATKSLFKGKLGAEASTGARRIGKETAVQSGTEAVEEGVSYLAGTAGTIKGVDAAELAQNMLEGAIVGGGLGAGIQGGKEYFSKNERAKLADVVRNDLEAKGETPTDEQVGAVVDNIIRIQKKGKTDEGDTETGTDAGRAESGISISEQQETGESATGTTTPPPGSLGGDTGPTDTSGVGEGSQQGALIPISSQAASEANKLFNTNKTENPDGTIAYGLPTPAVNKQIQAYTLGAIDASNGLDNPELAAKFKGKAKQAYEAGRQYAQSLAQKQTDQEMQLPSGAADQNNRKTYETSTGPWTYFEPGAIVNQSQYPGQPAKVTKVLDEGPGSEFTNMYEIEIDVEGHPEGFDENGNPVKTVKSIASDKELNRFNPPQQETEVQLPSNVFAKNERAAEIANSLPNNLKTLLDTAMEQETEQRKKLIVGYDPYDKDWSANQSRSVKAGKARAAFIKAFNKQYPELENNNRRQGEVTAESVYDYAIKQEKQKTQTPSNSESTSPRIDEILPGDILNQGLHPEVEQAINNDSISNVLKFYSAKGGKFISAFAKRLQELGLTTNIYFNNEETLCAAYIDQAKGQKERFLTYVQANYPDTYRKYFEPIEKKYTAYNPEAIRMLSYYFTNINNNVTIVENGVKTKLDTKPIKQDLVDLAKVYRGVNRTLTNSAGSYFSIQDAISINTARGGDKNSTVLHEITHAATYYAIHNPGKLNAQQLRAIGNLQILYQNAKAKINTGQYGFKTLDEFISEAFTNPAFQKELRKLKTSMKSDQSMWSKFIQLVAQLLGSDNVLFHTMANADIIFSANKGSVSLDISNQFSDQTTEDMPSVSYGLKDFKLNPGERGDGGIFNFMKNLIKGRLDWKDVNKENLGNFLDNVNDNYRQYLLGGLTLDQLTDMAGEDIPAFKAYVKEVDAMIATRNKIMAEGDKPIKAWTELIKDNPTKAEELAKMMIAATLNKIDPDPTGVGHKPADLVANPIISEQWAKMISGKDGDKALAIYKQVRGFYERRMDEYVAIQQQRLIEREQAKGTDPKEIDRLVIEQRKAIQEDIIQPYFPIKRFGEYWIQQGSGKTKKFMQFENAGARNAAMQQMRQHFYKELSITKNSTKEEIKEVEKKFAYEIRSGEGFTELSRSSLADVSQLGKLKERIDAVSADIAADPNAVGNEVNTLRDALKDSLDQYVLEITPNQSIRKMFLHRNNIQGASADMLRAFAESRYRIAYQRSRFEHMPQLFKEVDFARLSIKEMPHSRKTSLNRALVRELELNLKSGVLEPPKVEGWVRHLTQFGFLHFLTSPASAVINMMAIPSIYIPFARARYGIGPVTSTLAKYTTLLGGTGYVNEKTGRYEFLSLARSSLKDMPLLDKNGNKVLMDKMDDDGVTTKVPMTYADAYDKGVLLQAIDTTLSHESASVGDQPSEDYTGKWQKFMYYVSLPFHAAEKFNRETTYMTTFELAYKKYINDTKNPYTPQVAFEKASQDARDLVQKTMFNYNTINKPRYFRGNIASLVLQFKMYPQQMTVLMARTFYQSMGSGMQHDLDAYKERIKNSANYDQLVADKEAELKQIRKEATESFWGMMGMTFLTAGMSGLPLFFIISGVASAFHAAFGEDDEPYNFDNWFKNWCGRTFGNMIGDTISRGALSQVTGANFADRTSINLSDMWFPNVKKSQDEVQYMQNVITNLMGPVMGATLGYAEALKRLNDGHYERAMEAMLPAGLKNIFVGTRYMVEGKALTLKGDTLDSHISAKEAVGQMLGFSPEDTAQKQKAAMEKKNFDLQIEGRKQDLKNAFFIAFDSRDSSMQGRVIQKITRFNKTNPEYAIDADGLIDSIRKHYQQRALNNMSGGVSINKKAMGRLSGMSDYAKD